MSTKLDALTAQVAAAEEELAMHEFRAQLYAGLRELKDPRAHEFMDAPDKVTRLRAKLVGLNEQIELQGHVAIAKDFVAVHELEAQQQRPGAAADVAEQKAAILKKYGKHSRHITVNP